MRLSKEERKFLERLKPTFPLRRAITCEDNSLDSRIAAKLCHKGIITMCRNNYTDKISIWLSDSGWLLLQEHPELLHRNAFSAFAGRLRVFIKENFITAFSTFICVIMALLIAIFKHG